jgi:hypothetical protein
VTKKPTEPDSIAGELREIKVLLQDLLIIEAARAGVNKAEVRKILGVADKRVSATWRYLRIADKK